MTLEALIGAEFKTRPYDHQMKEFERYAEAPARAKAWTMRTGKTKSVIDKACHLYRAGKIDGVLVFAPNGVHANWITRELPIHTWRGVDTDGLVWRSTAAGAKGIKAVRAADRAAWTAAREAWWKRLATVRDNRRLMWLAVNSESMTRPDVRKAVARFIKHRRVFVVFDESDDFGTPGAKRTHMARALARRCAYSEILSGTLLHGGLLAAFSQFELLKKGALGFEKFDDFKNRYGIFEQARGAGGRTFPRLVGYQREAELRERMSKFMSVVLREDCADMPDLVPEDRRIAPSPQQMEAYRELHRSFMLRIDREDISVGERAQRLGKMQQVFSGFVIDETGRRVKIPGENPRLDALSEEVYLAPGKVIVWCQFQADMDYVAARLLLDGHKVAQYHGRVSDKTKQQALLSFMENRDVNVLIGHPKSGGRGVDMSIASSIIWYSHTFSARLRAQAMERATKIGGKNIHVVDFIAPGPDEYILSVIRKHISVASALAGVGMRDFLRGIEL